MSVGGAAGAVLDGTEGPAFVKNLASGLIATASMFGIDGIDLDIENRAGKPEQPIFFYFYYHYKGFSARKFQRAHFRGCGSMLVGG